ncbi:hypothetical protein IVB05_09535 [Bradyrhizobium sp. 170]|nr:hypothetical protein IVB05_09535 [Bradyrhizobium sp. 170]
MLGKLVAVELGGGTSSVTRNPINPQCTPRGASSGSAAAIGAGALPDVIGSETVGSIIKAAGSCGEVAIKPKFGAVHRGEQLAPAKLAHPPTPDRSRTYGMSCLRLHQAKAATPDSQASLDRRIHRASICFYG